MLGDQNAGKSTFLHTFSYSDDANFLRLASYLPTLSACFHNARFLPTTDLADLSAARDEPPYLDTDIGRASFLMTLENFAFFANEFGFLDTVRARFQPDSRYAVVQLIEIGGDHLDELKRREEHDLDASSNAATNGTVSDILRRSAALLATSERTVYFINAASLFDFDAAITTTTHDGTGLEALPAQRDPPWLVRPAAVRNLLARLDYLSDALGGDHQVLVLVARMPPLAPDESPDGGEDTCAVSRCDACSSAASAGLAGTPSATDESRWHWVRRSVDLLNQELGPDLLHGPQLQASSMIFECARSRPGLGNPSTPAAMVGSDGEEEDMCDEDEIELTVSVSWRYRQPARLASSVWRYSW